MSRIDDLIAEYCPDGVERRPLGAIAKLYRGNGLQKKDFTDKGIGCIHYGQIYTRYNTFTAQTISFVDKKLADKLLKVHPNDLIVTATSENLEDVCKAVAWLGESDIVTGGHSIVVRHHQNAKYLSYYFQTLDFFQRKRAYVHGTKVMEIKKDDLAKIAIPIPPLPVQEEIVRILDSFSSLEAELEAELETRRKQYAYYRNELLSQSNLEALDGRPIAKKTMGDLFDMKAGIHINGKLISEVENKEASIPCYGGNGIRGYVREANQTGTALLIGRQGALCGNVCLASGAFYATEHAVVTRCDDRLILPGYAFYMLTNRNLNQYKSAGAQPGLAVGKLRGIEFPVPSLATQQKVVDILDRFDALTTSLTDGLPAEIEARRKQHEYYRDRLLSFDELAV